MPTNRPVLDAAHFNPQARLPYGLTVEEVKATIQATHDFFFDLNAFLVGRGYGRLEELLLGNSFAGILSEVLVKSLADSSSTLTRNRLVGGYPDLIRRDMYPNDSVLRAKEGVEVKASKQTGGWQGHNPESGCVMIFRYVIDTTTLPVENRAATQVVEVLAAKLTPSDWNFSGRSGTSRRTITASINKTGMAKLRANPVYQHPDFAGKPRRG